VAQRDERDAGPTLRARRAQLGQEAVVGPGSSEGEIGVVDLPRRQPSAERRRAHPRDRIGVGEQHVGRDGVLVELSVAYDGVVGAAEALRVGGLPAHDVLEVRLERRGALHLLAGRPVVEGRVEAHLKVGPVVGQR
jgi:hypothetical protein